ncbi:hypothetical protein [Sinomonas sp. ASV322]|uniref:hypothetical protein n=1 Tax=Sinomonas sp. ASV322 TaxID=3041920 RepID=UPI0027DD39D2|nr:hypothetical protein [Sinomonas sp. ASV322]MDQ4503944.1 hypothetical protein [Sinomonas sp. ASV322]
MPERTSESDRTSELTSVESPTESFDAPAPGWGAPAWGAPQHQATHDAGAPAAVVGHHGEPAWSGAEPVTPAAADDEPFVPAPRYRMGRFTKVLACACLVLAGALGGAAVQKVVDVRNGVTGRGNFSQFTPGTGQNGAGTGQTGGTNGGQGGFGSRSSQGAGAGSGDATPAPKASAPATAGGN